MQTGHRLQSSYDAIVIGAGLGGLSCAVMLAKNDIKTLVLEQHYLPGGYCHSFQRGPFLFDAAVEYVGSCGVNGDLYNAFKNLAVHNSIEFEEMDPDGFDRLLFPGLEVSIPRGSSRYEEMLVRQFPNERKGLHAYFQLLRLLWKEVHHGRVGLYMWKHGTYPEDCPTMTYWAEKTLSEALELFIHDSKLKAVLSGQCGDYGLPPSKADMLVHTTTVMHYYEGGAYYPRGGVKVIPAALVKRLESFGGELRLKTPVQRVLIKSGRAIGVELDDGTKILTKLIVSNADPKTTLLKFVGEKYIDPCYRKILKSLRYSLPCFQVYLGLDLDLRAHGVKSANYWYYPTYDIEAAYQSLFAGELPEAGLPFLLTSPTVKDPHGNLAPPGHGIIKIVAIVPYQYFSAWEHLPMHKRGREYAQFKQSLADRLIACAEHLIPGLSRRIVCCELGSPLTNVAYTRTPFGAMYGISREAAQTGPQGLNPATSIAGLYMTGTNIFYPGVLGATASGIMTAIWIMEGMQSNSMKSSRLTLNEETLQQK